MSLLPQVQKQVDRSIGNMKFSNKSFMLCRIVGVDARRRAVWVQHVATVDVFPVALTLPFNEVFRIPTPQSNWVWVLRNDDGSGGIPILYDRDYREPKVFETIEPTVEGA